ncbi:DUF452 family protein [Helicobacter saguini]|uniref:DUF452 family protein n=1 Tax=Helicobacter saguini TaxID=1548018 RepID=A0A347W5N5_9HELI|nr:pimeloyl-ACP methyl esterase BioG family protein [Helicobacter saguini]MWV61369.1 DUF452 family protein [Helicobacter saguini]MWV67962.1 DUF452 family protein [Helicobacter saguini]MWV70571.1 DUF452 family protein [Helicobacter saguini]MWV72474.1 DUF452 family protein [Helicobacter saguini]TLD94775.1 DUF452 family protein [Helicobacter saguini]
MKISYLHKLDSKDLIIFFAGFGSNPCHFSHLDSKFDVVMIYDYADFFIEFMSEKSSKINNFIPTQSYENLYLIAFSMGVCVASQILDSNMLNFKRKIAINGSNYGINDIFGIKEKTFKFTMKHFKLDDFKMKLFGLDSKIDFKDFIESKLGNLEFSSENVLKNELESLYNFIKKRNLIESKNLKENEFFWNLALISKQDLIFPQQNCLNFFENLRDLQDSKKLENLEQNSIKITQINAPHFPFFTFKSWDEICQM